jgi:hypothetical protein
MNLSPTLISSYHAIHPNGEQFVWRPTGKPGPRRLLSASLLGLLLVLAVSMEVQSAVTDLVGHYEGAWTNLTFGSTGKAVMDIQVNGANAAIAFDMDGYVFGYIDPPLLSMPGTVTGDVVTINNHGVGIFGDMAGTLSGVDGALSLTLTNIPGGTIQRVTVSGTVGGGRISVNYQVDFVGAPSATNPARGVMGALIVRPLTITRAWMQGNAMQLQWSGGKGPYQVQTRTDLAKGGWVIQGASTTNTSASLVVSPGSPLFVRIGGQ